MHVDVCNGDADGLCALQQLRLAEPRDAVLVTGRKRDIALLARVDAGAGDVVTVLDVSLEVNRDALLRLLARGAQVAYFDHHACRDLPRHPRLAATIDTRPDTCTSLIVDRTLGGGHRRWALAGAYGDGLDAEADALARHEGLDAATRDALRELGIDLNYNAYGDSDEDLVVPPASLAALLRGHADPLAIAGDGSLARIRATRRADLAAARAQVPQRIGDHALAVLLPDAAWARRSRGTLAHDLARRHPQQAIAVLTPGRDGYVVSVRAPLARRAGADALCRRFGGEGRAGAAGIDRLPQRDLDAFLAAFGGTFTP